MAISYLVQQRGCHSKQQCVNRTNVNCNILAQLIPPRDSTEGAAASLCLAKAN